MKRVQAIVSVSRVYALLFRLKSLRWQTEMSKRKLNFRKISFQVVPEVTSNCFYGSLRFTFTPVEWLFLPIHYGMVIFPKKLDKCVESFVRPSIRWFGFPYSYLAHYFETWWNEALHWYRQSFFRLSFRDNLIKWVRSVLPSVRSSVHPSIRMLTILFFLSPLLSVRPSVRQHFTRTSSLPKVSKQLWYEASRQLGLVRLDPPLQRGSGDK